MSEMISDISAAFKERVVGPFFGYIFFYFVLFNWDWIYFFIFSNLTAEQKLNTINITYDYWRVVWVIILGTFTSLFTPFLNLFLKKIHAYAFRKEKEVDYDNENYYDIIKADRELKISLKIKENSTIKNEIEELEKRYTDLNKALDEMALEAKKLTERTSVLTSTKIKLKEEVDELKIESQKLNASTENNKKLSEVIDSKNKEISELNEIIVSNEKMFTDIASVMTEKQHSLNGTSSRTKKVDIFLREYGYKPEKGTILRL
ncbi:TPA: hypothetical protein ACSTLU_001772 [Serratia fonticola]